MKGTSDPPDVFEECGVEGVKGRNELLDYLGGAKRRDDPLNICE